MIKETGKQKNMKDHNQEISQEKMADGKSFWHGANIETENNKTKD